MSRIDWVQHLGYTQGVWHTGRRGNDIYKRVDQQQMEITHQNPKVCSDKSFSTYIDIDASLIAGFGREPGWRSQVSMGGRGRIQMSVPSMLRRLERAARVLGGAVPRNSKLAQSPRTDLYCDRWTHSPE